MSATFWQQQKTKYRSCAITAVKLGFRQARDGPYEDDLRRELWEEQQSNQLSSRGRQLVFSRFSLLP